MKKLLILLLFLSTFFANGQTYVTKDTSFLGYLARISYINGNTDSTNLILIMHGNGEAGTGTNNSQTYGPHYWMNNGWDGAVLLGNGNHYPVYVTLQQPALYTRPWNLKPKIDAIKTRFKVKAGGLHAMGLSGGGWCWQQVATYKPTSGDISYYGIFRSLINIQGVIANDTYDATLAYPNKFGNAAKNSQLRYVGFEQVNDNRGISTVVKNINDSIAGRAFMYWTNFGSSGHSNFNDFYNPNTTNWTLTNPDVQLSNGGATNTIPFAGGQSIYQWAIRQSADTSLVSAGAVIANAGVTQTINLPTTSTSVTGTASGGTSPYTYAWTRISGPNTPTIVSASSATTSITGMILGTYVFRLTVTDNLAATGTSDITINITYSTADLSISSNSTSGTSPASLTSTTSPNHNIVTTKWSKLSSPSSTAKKLVFIGSSTTAGYGTTGYVSNGTNDSSYVRKVLNYYYNLGIISTTSGVNLGISSTDIFDGQPSWYTAVGSQHVPLAGRNITAALALNPDIIFVSYPSNSYDFLSITEVMAAHRRIKATVDSAGKVVFFSTTQPRPGFSPSEELKLLQIRDSIIGQFPNNYVEFYNPIADEVDNHAFVPSYSFGDGVHVNDAGHRQLFNRFVEANVFKGLVSSTSVITTPTTNNTTVSSLVSGFHKFQVSIIDDRGLAATSVSTTEVLTPPCNTDAPVTYTIGGGTEIYMTDASGQPWKGGDTINILAGTYSVIEIDSFGGDNCRDIVIRNWGGQVNVTGNMRFKHGVHNVTVTGNGHAGTLYGFKLTNAFSAESANHFTVRRVDITNSGGVGFYIKQDPYSAYPNTIYPNYLMNKITVDSCYVHNVDGEGMYIGHTYPNGDPANSMNIPIRLDSVTISNCIVDSTGWDGIQLSNARNGNRIFGNTVTNFGLHNIGGQIAGIIMGGNSNGKIYNNSVRKGKGNGIQYFGFGAGEIYNNVIDSVGYSGRIVSLEVVNDQSIYCNDNANTVESNTAHNVNIHDNIIKHYHLCEAVRVANNNATSTNSTTHDNQFLIPGATEGWQALKILQSPVGSTEYNNTLITITPPSTKIRRMGLKFRQL